MKKTYLLTPGPTPIPESVLSGFAQPIIHHRTPQFQALFEDVKSGLRELFQTQQEVLLLASTWTGAMDATVSNLFRKGDSVITVNGGKFGERWTKIATAYGLNPYEIKLEPGSALIPLQLKAAIKACPEARAILFQA